MKSKIKELTSSIQKINTQQKINIMEVCGTHTMAISRSGIRQLIPPNINLISGPGCPVCVTSISDIDCMLEIINNYDVCIFTFGDMIRVPGSNSSLYMEKSKGKDTIILAYIREIFRIIQLGTSPVFVENLEKEIN